jgi:flagellar basal body-associated protein FliL
MSDKKAEAQESTPVDTGPKPSQLPLLVSMINTVAILAAVGILTFTKILYKRPKITEESERANIEKMKNAKPEKSLVPASIVFESSTINIAATPEQPKSSDGTSNQIQGKLHYATVGFTIEISDETKKADVETIRPQISDQFLTLMGKKQFHELTSVQGRYVLKTQILELANELWNKRQKKDDRTTASGDMEPSLFTNLYFTNFIVQ